MWSRIGRAGTALALSVSGVVLLGGCLGDPSADRNGSAQPRSPSPTPSAAAPAAGTCYVLGAPGERNRQVPCEGPHLIEVVRTGELAGAEAQAENPPLSDSPTGLRLYQECAAAAGDFLGDDWRGGWIGLSVDLPTTMLWTAGARWYSCSLHETEPAYQRHGPMRERTGSLRGALAPAGSGNLRRGCLHAYTDKDGKLTSVTPVPCNERHEAEFVGVVDAAARPFPLSDRDLDTAFVSGCQALIAAYVGVPVDKDFKYRTGYYFEYPLKDEWARGNRGVACFQYDDKPRTGSVKGVGPKGLPAD